jgi:uncharacterized protein (TIGR02453 family)
VGVADFPGFPKELFAFLTELGANNNREWFEANKDRYLQYAKEPTIGFVVAMKDGLANISPSYIADPRSNGGSMFRIYRDTRFSPDKRPYKENVGCQFRHSAGKDAHAPGFYVHLQPGACFAGGGIWKPPTPVLARIRTHIDARREEWMRIKTYLAEDGELSEIQGDRSKRPPRGFSADHPLVEDLKLKWIFVRSSFSDGEVTSPRFIEQVESVFERLTPFMRFINEALGLSF